MNDKKKSNGEGFAEALKGLAESEPAKLDFYKDFDAGIPASGEMFESIGKNAGALIEREERERGRRRKYRWIASGSLAAAVAIVLLATTVYHPGSFLGGAGMSADNMPGTEDQSVEIAAGGEASVTGTGVIPAELPAPQSEYTDIYDAICDYGTVVMTDEDGNDREYIKDMAYEVGLDGGEWTGESAAVNVAPPAPSAPPSDAPSALESPVTTQPAAPSASLGKQSSTDSSNSDESNVSFDEAGKESPVFSDTNVQTEGVQEADVVKTDGKYIYTANSKSICITAANAGEPDVLSEIKQVTGKGQVYFEMYINGDTLTLVRNGYNNLKKDNSKKEKLFNNGSIEYVNDGYRVDTSVDIYDVSDRENPRKVKSLSQSGEYTDSRMIGDKLYLISSYSSFGYGAIDDKDPRTYVPLFADGDKQIVSKPDDIAMPPKLETPSYTVVSGIDTSKGEFVSHESLLGDSYTVYASEDNLYLSAYKETSNDVRIGCYDVYRSESATRITRLSLKDGKVNAEASADVPGDVNDQFSLDENGGYLRVVATKSENVQALYVEEDSQDESSDDEDGDGYSEKYYDGDSADGSADDSDKKAKKNLNETIGEARAEIEKKYGKIDWYMGDINLGKLRVVDGSYDGYRDVETTGLYVLDMGMKLVGSVKDLAPDEEVYSCRYLGDVAYFVTFRNTDPLFSVDLSDPKKPKVMGKLKIPGFSEYLHPYADGLLFGLGNDADEDDGEVLGLKVSMFDNSDPYDVKEKDKLVLKKLDYSYATDNHKAILVDERKSIVAFPADDRYVILRYDVGSGFKRVMDVRLEIPGEYDDMYDWYNGLRGLFIDDVFYVIAPDSIHSYDMQNDFKALGSVSLGSKAKYVDSGSYELPDGYEVPPIDPRYDPMPLDGFGID